MAADKNREFLELYNPSHLKLGRFVASMVWDKEEAKDVVSETVLIALENFEKLRNKEAFVSFLFGISIRVIRKKQRRSWRSVLFNDDKWTEVHNTVHISENTSDAGDLHKLLNTLNRASREAIVLFEISGFSIKEICEIQNSSLSAVKSRLARARTALQKAVEEEKKSLTINL